MECCCFERCYFLLVWFVLLGRLVALADHANFTFNGFRGANLSLAGSAAITADGILTLTDAVKLQVGHAFFPFPLRFRAPSNGTTAIATFSFSSTFVFAVVSPVAEISGHGIAFLISPSTDFGGAAGAQYLGLFNTSSNGDPANRVAAVELDMIQNADLGDINDNHVGIDLNSLSSVASFPAGYYGGAAAAFTNLSISSGEPMQMWVEYDGGKAQLNVTLSPMGMAKPAAPLLSSAVDLSNVTAGGETMYVGFSASTGTFTTSHVILGWSFAMGVTSTAPAAFELSSLPSLPRRRASTGKSNSTQLLVLLLSIGVPAAALAAAAAVAYAVIRRRRFSELLEDWEQEYGPQRFSYRDLHRATRGFSETELLGAGGFGKVYRGVLPGSGMEVAVKKVCHESKQGVREFVAEVVTIGRLRHRSLVQLLGYCRRKGELLLVYDFMANGSLDRFLFDRRRPSPLDWSLRYRIIRDVAAGLVYLHEEWEQVVVHRDVKASNVLLDGEFNGKLGDFGLARLYDHRTGPETTRVVGTMGYIAPELTGTGRATTATDVFAFGAFLLEVACGRRPIETQLEAEEMILVEWVLDNWKKGDMMSSVDPRLQLQGGGGGGGGYAAAEEVGTVLVLGLLCSHPSPAVRPGMKLVAQILDGDAPLPELASPGDFIASFQQWQQFEAFDNYVMSYPSSVGSEKLLSGSDSSVFRET